MTVTVVVSNRKGGTGKTTAAVNIAAELASHDLRVLLVDLDTQSHCAVGLGIKIGRGAPTVHDIFRRPQTRLMTVVQPTAVPLLALAPGDPHFEHGEGARDEGLLRQALADAEIQASFDIVVVDTPPSLDALLLNGLIAADWVLVPFIPHPLSQEGVRQLMRVLFKVISGTNHDLKIAGFLPMMGNDHVRVHRQVAGNLAHQFGAFRLLPAIRTDIRLAESFSAGKPIRLYAPTSRAAEDFAKLGIFLAQLCQPENT